MASAESNLQMMDDLLETRRNNRQAAENSQRTAEYAKRGMELQEKQAFILVAVFINEKKMSDNMALAKAVNRRPPTFVDKSNPTRVIIADTSISLPLWNMAEVFKL